MKLKHFIVLFIMLFTLGAVAQETVEATVGLEPSFNAVKEFFLPAVLAALSVLWMDTMKHIKGGNYDIGIAVKTKFIPLILTIGISVGAYYLIAYLPFTKGFIEIAVEADLSEVTAIGLMTPISILIDNLYKTYTTKVSQE